MSAGKNINTILSSVHFWLPLAGFGAFWLLLFQLRFINTGSLFAGWELRGVIREGGLILLQMNTVMYFVYYATRYFDKKFPATDFSIRRYIYEIVTVILTGFLINIFFHLLFIQFVVIPEDDMNALDRKLRNILLVTQSLIIVMYGLLTAFRIYNNLKKKQTEILQWQKEFALAQFEALKNQLNPHFLFNSLSVLTSLVYTDAGKAEIFIEKLSKTYRYLLDQREKEAVHISEEFSFLDNYAFIIEQRYGNKISILATGINLNESLYILPHSFLIILEYIIGSNTMSTRHPLQISVEIRQNKLLFQFKQQTKDLINQHLSIQFASLQERYREMNKKITILNDDLSQLQIITVQLFQQHD